MKFILQDSYQGHENDDDNEGLYQNESIGSEVSFFQNIKQSNEQDLDQQQYSAGRIEKEYFDDQSSLQNFHQEQDRQDSYQSQKSTDNVSNKKQYHPYMQKKQQNVSKKKPIARNIGKKESQQQPETKNLPKFYANLILNRLENEYLKSQKSNQQIKKKISKFNKKPSSLKTLREMLQDQFINEISINYITSFDFLDQLLGSERLQDVSPPIKYLNKFYIGCFNQDSLRQWKES